MFQEMQENRLYWPLLNLAVNFGVETISKCLWNLMVLITCTETVLQASQRTSTVYTVAKPQPYTKQQRMLLPRTSVASFGSVVKLTSWVN